VGSGAKAITLAPTTLPQGRRGPSHGRASSAKSIGLAPKPAPQVGMAGQRVRGRGAPCPRRDRRRPLSKPRSAALEERLASGPAARAPSSASQGLRVGRLTVGDRRNRRRTKKP